MTGPWLGVIADDVTGATDAAGYLVREGTATIQYLGIPSEDAPRPEGVGCVVIALKTRSVPAEAAAAESLRALEWLLEVGVEHVFFKYCSTFDSTARGNIGPVADAIARRLGTKTVIFSPSAPENGRTVYQGELYVWNQPLAESPLRDHPINPMRDSNLSRLLAPQSPTPVRAVNWQQVARGPDHLAAQLAVATKDLERVNVIVDAITDRDLDTIAAAALEFGFSTGAAGLASALGRQRKAATSGPVFPDLPVGGGAVISGSCSSATQLQVAHFSALHPSFEIDPMALSDGVDVVQQATEFLREQLPGETPLVYSTADPAELERVHELLGAEVAAGLVERALGAIAVAMSGLGVRRLVVAGGETSGAVVAALGATALLIGPEVDPGVPWTMTTGEDPIALLLKSGNFGSADFFSKALASDRGPDDIA